MKNILPIKVIGLPTFQSENTLQLKKYFLVFSGFVSASQTLEGVALIDITFFTIQFFMISSFPLANKSDKGLHRGIYARGCRFSNRCCSSFFFLHSFS
jgi:hypothetical protein